MLAVQSCCFVSFQQIHHPLGSKRVLSGLLCAGIWKFTPSPDFCFHPEVGSDWSEGKSTGSVSEWIHRKWGLWLWFRLRGLYQGWYTQCFHLSCPQPCGWAGKGRIRPLLSFFFSESVSSFCQKTKEMLLFRSLKGRLFHFLLLERKYCHTSLGWAYIFLSGKKQKKCGNFVSC